MSNINIDFAKYIPKNGVLYQFYSILIEHHFLVDNLESELDYIFNMRDANHLQSQDQEYSIDVLVS